MYYQFSETLLSFCQSKIKLINPLDMSFSFVHKNILCYLWKYWSFDHLRHKIKYIIGMKCTKRICLLSSPSQCPRFMGPVAVNIRGYSQQKSHLRRLHVATFFSYTIAIKSRPYRRYIGTESRLSLHKVTMRKAP